MVKYCGHYITAQEVPDEISLVLSITNCLHHCEGCHSPWLQADIGDELTPEILRHLIKAYKDGITCVCFMGTGGDYEGLAVLTDLVWEEFLLNVCVYTGDDDMAFVVYCEEHKHMRPDFIKCGHYDKEAGGLSSPTTNQRMYRLEGDDSEVFYKDITSWFWRKKE